MHATAACRLPRSTRSTKQPCRSRVLRQRHSLIEVAASAAKAVREEVVEVVQTWGQVQKISVSVRRTTTKLGQSLFLIKPAVWETSIRNLFPAVATLARALTLTVFILGLHCLNSKYEVNQHL